MSDLFKKAKPDHPIYSTSLVQAQSGGRQKPPSPEPPDQKPPASQPLAKAALSQEALGRRLIEAAQKGDTDAARQLLAQGADMNVQDDEDGTPIEIAASNGHSDIALLLLGAWAAALPQAGASTPDARIPNSETPDAVVIIWPAVPLSLSSLQVGSGAVLGQRPGDRQPHD